jgi:DNA invertase Pin-like site-specific DNA recombinase
MPYRQRDALLKAGVLPDHIYSDVVSGTKQAKTRPGMKQLLEFARTADTVVVGRIDRLGRSLLDVLATVADLREQGIQVQSISDGIDPSTTSGRLMLNMLATLAEYERELIVERVNAGIAASRASGTVFGRPVSNPVLVAEKLKIVQEHRANGKTAAASAELVGWSRATLYRHQGKSATGD